MHIPRIVSVDASRFACAEALSRLKSGKTIGDANENNEDRGKKGRAESILLDRGNSNAYNYART